VKEERRQRDEVKGEWRKLHNEELYDLYSPNIIRVIKSKKIREAGHVVRMVERRDVYRDLVGKPGGRVHLEYPGADGSIILRWIFRKCDGAMDCIDLDYNRDR
jgi:hypothetical protein